VSKAGVAKTLEYRKPRKRVRLEDREINGVMVTGKKMHILLGMEATGMLLRKQAAFRRETVQM